MIWCLRTSSECAEGKTEYMMYTESPVVSPTLNKWMDLNVLGCNYWWKTAERNIVVVTTKYLLIVLSCWYWSCFQNCHDKGGGKGLASFLEVPVWKSNLLSGRIHKTCPGGLCRVCAAFCDWWDMNNDQESVLLWNCKSPQSNKIGHWPLNSSSTIATEN